MQRFLKLPIPYDNCVDIPTGAFNFNQEKALVGAFSVIVQPVVEPMEPYTSLP